MQIFPLEKICASDVKERVLFVVFLGRWGRRYATGGSALFSVSLLAEIVVYFRMNEPLLVSNVTVVVPSWKSAVSFAIRVFLS